MNRLQSIWRTLKMPVMSAACWMAVYGTALAQPPKQEKGGGSWIASYGLILGGIVLGMLFVCRSSRRRERAKPVAYVEGKLMGKAED